MGTRLLLHAVFIVQLLLASGWITRYEPPTTVPTTASTTTTKSPERIIEQSQNITIHSGKDTMIKCRTGVNISSCLWLWESPLRDQAPTVVLTFPGHGNGSADCSIQLVNVSQIQTGWWTCQAKTPSNNILHSEPVFFQVFTSPIITFEMIPVNRTFSIGGPAELECKTSIPVQSCQWSFQQKGQTEPLVMVERPPLDKRDCSFKLDHVSYEQVGTWRCGARVDEGDSYTYSKTAYIDVEHKEEAFPVEFTEEPVDTEMKIGETGRLHCKVRTEAHIEDCRWYWQPIGHSKAWNVLMREFLPSKNDCSIEFANVTADPEGLWTCHVKPIHSKKFKASKSAKLTVRGELAVSTLSRELSISEGEPLTMYCMAEEPAKACQWKQKALFETDVVETNTWVVKKTFQSAGNESRDCSLHFGHVKMEHQGLWICGIKFLDDKPFHEATPTAVIVKKPNKVQFVESPRIKLAAENISVTLNCSTLSAVRECVWMWYEEESKVAERVVKYNFTIDKQNSYDCSVVIPKVERELQGIWQCAVKYGDVNHPNISYAPPFSLTVVKTGPIMFRRVSPRVHTLLGRSSLLECVTREPVEECLWLYNNKNKTSEFLEFNRFQPTNFNNCSLMMDQGGDSGWWTCGARNPGETNFTMATPFRLEYFHPENVVTRSLVSSGDLLVLICQISTSVPMASCDWIHPSQYNILEFNDTGKYLVENHPENGTCSLSFRPMLVDVGQWKCIFSTDNQNNVLGEGSFTVLNSPQNVRLGWIVGVLATTTLLLTVLLFVVVTCRVYQCSRSSKAKVQLNKPVLENNKRYSEDPTKGINFSFNESPEVLADYTPNKDNHHYERVVRYTSQRPSYYENIN